MPALNYITPQLEQQRLEGTVFVKLLARQLVESTSHICTISVDVASNKGHPITNILQSTESQTGPVDSHLNLTFGPFSLSPLDIHRGQRIAFSIDAPTLEISMTGNESCIEFSHNLAFLPASQKAQQFQRQRLIGQCIYCFTRLSPLSKEHVIPLGLTITSENSGNLLLHEASCKSCAGITSRFELDALRCALIGPRIALGLQTRRKKQRPTKFPLWLEHQGRLKKVMVPANEYPIILAPPVLAAPAHLSGESYTSGVVIRRFEAKQVSGLPLAVLAQKYGGEFNLARIKLDYNPTMFAKLIGKIAYGYAVLVLGLDAISNAYVLPAIQGESSDIGRWVGSVEGDSIGSNEGLHALGLNITDNNEIHVIVRLFAQFNVREYVVIVGVIKEEYVVWHT